MPLSFQDKIRVSGEKPVTPTTELSFASKIRPVQSEENPYRKDVREAAQSGISQIKEGFQQFKDAGASPIGMLEGTLKSTAGVINTITSPLAPVFKPISQGIDYAGDKISNIPAVQKFAGTKLGELSSRVAEDVINLTTITQTVAGFAAAPKVKTAVENRIKSPTTPKSVTPKEPVNPIVTKVESELSKVDSQYAKLRKMNEYSKDGGAAVRRQVAESNVLNNSIDENGVIRTKQPGGAVELYEEATLGASDNIVRNLLEKEGSKVGLDEVQTRLTDSIMNSGLEGADLKVALNKVKREIAGYKLRADPQGFIPTTLLQDAKIGMKANYLTPPDIQVYQKAIKNGLKTTIEKNSSLPIKHINEVELAPHLKVIKYLEALDGLRVNGGKLGKYFAQISGNIIGGVAGSAVGGPIGSALGTVVGGELSGRLKGSIMKKTFGTDTKIYAKQSPVLKEAIKSSQSKSLGNRK